MVTMEGLYVKFKWTSFKQRKTSISSDILDFF